MSRFILGVIAVATIAAGATESAAVPTLPVKASAPFTWDQAYAGANVGIISPKGQNLPYRQFACIRVGRRLVC